MPIGNRPSATNAPAAALTNTMTPSVTWNVSRMLGASTDRVAFSISANAWSSASMHDREHPAAHDARAQGDRLVADAGEHVVGEQHRLGRRGLLGAPFRLCVEHRLHETGGCRPAAFRLGARHEPSPLETRPLRGRLLGSCAQKLRHFYAISDQSGPLPRRRTSRRREAGVRHC